jgi:hypothetical protein
MTSLRILPLAVKQLALFCCVVVSIAACKKHEDKPKESAAAAPATTGGACPADTWKPADWPVCVKLPAECKASTDDKNAASCGDNGGISVELAAQSYDSCLTAADGGSHGKFDDIDKKSFLASGDFLGGKGKWFTYKRQHMIGLFSCIRGPGDKVFQIQTSTDLGDQAELDAIEHTTWAK